MLIIDTLFVFASKRSIWAQAMVVMVICQHLNSVGAMMTSADDQSQMEQVNDQNEVEVDENFTDALPKANEPYYKAKQRWRIVQIFNSLFGQLYVKYLKNYSSIKKGLMKKKDEVVEQMILAKAEDLMHLKEIMKTVLYMSDILTIIHNRIAEEKQIKGEVIEYIKNKATNAEDKEILTESDRAIKRENRELDNAKKGLRATKADLYIINKAELDENWNLLKFISNRASNNSAYCEAMNQWKSKLGSSEPGEELDKWDFINGHLDKGLTKWKMGEIMESKHQLPTVKKIQEDPTKALHRVFPHSLLLSRANVIMEWRAREEFHEVAKNCMRNYAAISEAMVSTEIQIYFLSFENLFQEKESTSSEEETNSSEGENKPFIVNNIWAENGNKPPFDRTFDIEMDKKNNVKNKQQNNKSVQKIGQFFNSWYQPKKSTDWHTKHLLKTIDEYSRKVLMAQTRIERSRAMEMLKTALFLIEIQNEILTKNPNEDLKTETEKTVENRQTDVGELEIEIQETEEKIKNLTANLQALKISQMQQRNNEHYSWHQEEAESEQLRQAQGVTDATSDRNSENDDDQPQRGEQMDQQQTDALETEIELLSTEIEDTKVTLTDLISKRPNQKGALTKAQRKLENVKTTYRRSRNEAKKMLKYLDLVRNNPKKNLEAIITEMDSKHKIHPIETAYDIWKGEKITKYLLNQELSYVDIEHDWHVRKPNNHTEMIVAQVERTARHKVQEVASLLIMTYAEISKGMSVAELRNCVTVLSWFNGITVELDETKLTSYVNFNGNVEDIAKFSGLRSRMYEATYIVHRDESREKERCMKGIAADTADATESTSRSTRYEGTTDAELGQQFVSDAETYATDYHEQHLVSEPEQYAKSPSQTTVSVDQGYTSTNATDYNQQHLGFESEPFLSSPYVKSPSPTTVSVDQGYTSATDTIVSSSGKATRTRKNASIVSETSSLYIELPPKLKASPAGGFLGRNGAGSETETSAFEGIDLPPKYGTTVNPELSRRTVKKFDYIKK